MSNITLFSFGTREIRVTDQNGDPWFILRDLLEAMETSTPVTVAIESIKQGLGDGFNNVIPILDSLRREQNATIVAESAATYLLSRSNTEKGRELNRFIHVDVLPSIRKTGSYNTPITPGEQAVRIAQETMRLGTALGIPLAHTQRLALQRIADETGIRYTLPPMEKAPTTAKKPISSRPYVQPIANYLAQRNGATVTVSEVKTALNLPIHNTAIGRILSGLGRTIHIACVNGRTTRFWN